MLEKLLPKKIDNQYKGLAIAKLIFVAVAMISIGRSLAHIFLPDGGAQSVATIPLELYNDSASKVIVGMFAQWGLTQLMLGIMFVLVIWRYQSLIPLMWLVIFFEYVGRLLLGLYKPFETSGTAPGTIGNFIFPVLSIIMLILSLQDPK